MKVMVIVKANAESEAGQMPSERLLTDMGNYNEELVKAGIMLAGEGLHPSSKGKRVLFSFLDIPGECANFPRFAEVVSIQPPAVRRHSEGRALAGSERPEPCPNHTMLRETVR